MGQGGVRGNSEDKEVILIRMGQNSVNDWRNLEKCWINENYYEAQPWYKPPSPQPFQFLIKQKF